MLLRPKATPRPMRSLGQTGRFYGVFAQVLGAQAPSASSGQAPSETTGQTQDGHADPASAGSALEQGPAQAAKVGYGVGQASSLMLQAHILVRAGKVDMALQALDRALAWIKETGVRCVEAEVWRMRGQLLLMAGDERSAEAETCFWRAIEVAREQQERWLELRATVSLARLWQGQGKSVGAKEALAAIYATFTEGFDTPDLIETRALLDSLVLPA
jgi:predicted ATPase